MADAPCKGLTALFFADCPADLRACGEPTIRAARAVSRAICEGCPQRLDCLAGAVARDERHGVWGSVSFPDEWRNLARAAQAAGAHLGACTPAERALAVLAARRAAHDARDAA